MKKIIFLLLCIIPFISVSANIQTYERTEENLRVHESIKITFNNKSEILKTPSVDEKQKIYDFADLIDDNQEQILFNLIEDFINNNYLDLVLVTINANWTNAQKYADNFYNYNYFGIGQTFDGLLILIDMDNREITISTSGKAILLFNDYRIEQILDGMFEQIQIPDYFKTFKTGIEKANHYVKAGIPDDNKDSYINDSGDYIYNPKKTFPIYMILGISAVISTIVLIIFIFKNKLIKKAYDAKEYINRDKCEVLKVNDNFITSRTSRVRISSDSSSSYSSRSGGSSTHRSSSGRSNGGGGRKF